MTRLWNAPDAFADDMIDGFVAANRDLVQRVDGGVVRATPTPDGQVAVVIGGGSGHYPAFGGMVGRGLAHGAAMGNLFASPSARQVESVARSCHRGGGVLLAYGNYAGDVLHFDAAEERLRADGIACRTVVVTDDIASAPAAERHRRRGIAGDLVVFRAAAAAAERGAGLDDVARIAARANDRTRSFGVAFGGCTLPGAAQPLFTVPDGQMALGLGIHGEPGIDTAPVPSADGLAETLVASLLAEPPTDLDDVVGARVVPILNGLGSVKYEEMFVVYRRVAELLETAGARIVDPHVGEYCTSFDMAGVSLTLLWLDDELAGLWSQPVETPGYRRSSPPAADASPAGAPHPEDAGVEVAAEDGRGDDASRAVALRVRASLAELVATVDAHADELGRLDAVAGDGDHGIGMQRGARAALAACDAALEAGAGARRSLAAAGGAWADRGGGTSGALWGILLEAVADRLGDTGVPSSDDVAAGIDDGTRGIMRTGGATVGDKTLVDALVPFRDALVDAVGSGAPLDVAWQAAARRAVDAAAATADLAARLGRARTHGDVSIGTPDAGAHSFSLIVTAVGGTLVTRTEGPRA